MVIEVGGRRVPSEGRSRSQNGMLNGGSGAPRIPFRDETRGCPTFVRCWHPWPMSTFVFRLKAPRPTFALDMSDEEREIMTRHAAHWQTWVESGQMVIFGPVLDGSGSWGLGVVEADDEEEVRAFAARDPVVTTGTATIEVGKMLAGFVRPRPATRQG